MTIILFFATIFIIVCTFPKNNNVAANSETTSVTNISNIEITEAPVKKLIDEIVKLAEENGLSYEEIEEIVTKITEVLGNPNSDEEDIDELVAELEALGIDNADALVEDIRNTIKKPAKTYPAEDTVTEPTISDVEERESFSGFFKDLFNNIKSFFAGIIEFLTSIFI